MYAASSNGYGQVNSARIMTDRETGRSRGFAFVEMENEGEADQAISALNGYTLDGRALNVNEARPKPDRGFGRRWRPRLRRRRRRAPWRVVAAVAAATRAVEAVVAVALAANPAGRLSERIYDEGRFLHVPRFRSWDGYTPSGAVFQERAQAVAAARDGAICAGPWLRSAGCVRASPRDSCAPPLRACARCRLPGRSAS